MGEKGLSEEDQKTTAVKTVPLIGDLGKSMSRWIVDAV
jgi:hypothetical protein